MVPPNSHFLTGLSLTAWGMAPPPSCHSSNHPFYHHQGSLSETRIWSCLLKIPQSSPHCLQDKIWTSPHSIWGPLDLILAYSPSHRLTQVPFLHKLYPIKTNAVNTWISLKISFMLPQAFAHSPANFWLSFRNSRGSSWWSVHCFHPLPTTSALGFLFLTLLATLL